MKPDFTVEERAERFQRRYTGPWRTAGHDVGPVGVTYRFRRRRRIEWARMDVAGHDLWTHAVWRGAVIPWPRPVVRWLARLLG